MYEVRWLHYCKEFKDYRSAQKFYLQMYDSVECAIEFSKINENGTKEWTTVATPV